MDELISRQAAIDALDEYFGRIGKLKRRGLTKGERAISLDVVGAIRTLPSAQRDKNKQKKGKWEQKEDPYGFFDTIPVCSVCGHTTKMRETYAYCPNCGAEMEASE